MPLQQKHLVWFVLTMPLIYLLSDRLINGTSAAVFFYWTGLISMVLIMATMLVTPAQRLLNNRHGTMWLLRQRRYLGVAGFLYMLAHAAVWMVGVGLERVIQSTTRLDVLIGWLSLILLTPLALTSNDFSVRKLGPRWKTVQQWIYVAAPVSLLHWLVAVKFQTDTLMTYGSAFAVIVILRLAVIRRKPKRNA